MRRLLLAGLVALVLPMAAVAATPSATGALDLETVMANPDWIGQAVERPYWSVDGQHLYYSLKRDGSPVRDLYRVDPASGQSTRLDASAMAQATGPAVFDRAHRQAAYILHGDVFLHDVASGKRVQVTQTPQVESAPQFSADGRALQFRDGNDWYSYDIAGAVSAPVAVLKFADDPQDKKPDALGEQQLEIFSTLRELKADKDALRERAEALAAADPGRAPMPFWLGDKIKLLDAQLSPDGRRLLLVTVPKHSTAGKAPQVTHFITDSGYPEQQDARVYVGRTDPAPQALLLLDLTTHAVHPLATDGLPGIKDDPLHELREKAIAALQRAGKSDQAKALKAPDVRPVTVTDGPGRSAIVWSDDGQAVAVQLRAIDNKDRWIASVDFTAHALVNQQRLSDEAWINWNFNDFGWLPDNHTLWYLSEHSGYSQLYAKALDGKARAITTGKFEVSDPVVSEDGRWFYLRANQVAPYSYDVYRVAATGGALSRVTHYQGMERFVLSPDDSQLAVLHSGPYQLAQLAVQPSAGGTARELTNTMQPAFTARTWLAPQIVPVPSSHGAGTIWAKYYGPAATPATSGALRPGVIFVHGAGYLQDVTLSWSHYFREQMFHNLLVQQGYVVLDMDYRASEGYGRAWRTAIYRQMGHPELEDVLDGKAWLVKHQQVDPQRVGIYGGSYGGFMTEMALLRAPGEFAAGAALRPVSDWTLYNHEYTSNILNDPQLDPEAYAISSPLTYAEQLRDPLLIEHGLIDDNVLAADSIRLYQRFIELHKKNFWMSLYPLERHGFVHADSWHDEYRRIEELFHTWLQPAPTTPAH